jgi:prevent-host-death family protein
VERSGREQIISDHGKPVIKIVPYKDNSEDTLESLRNTITEYLDPTEPVGLEDWDNLR